MSTGGERDLDPDGDGLTNFQEQSAGTDPTLRDTDRDGAADGAEIAAGTKSLDPSSTSKLPALGTFGRLLIAALVLFVGTRAYWANRETNQTVP